MAVDFNFVKTILSEYSADEQAAINTAVESRCKIDGLDSTIHLGIIGNAHTYMAIIMLAPGDASLSKKVGQLQRSRTSSLATDKIVSEYKEMYRALLSSVGLTPKGAGVVTPIVV